MNLRDLQRLALLTCFVGLTAGNTHAQEPIPTPSEQMKEAVGKLNKAPATIGQSLQGLRDAAAAKLKQTLGTGAKPDAKAAPVDLDLPQKAAEIPARAPALKEHGRDPFRPMTLRSKVISRQRENLSPLERFELGQLKIVGIVWDIKEPRAMIEDTAGLGYVIKIGTPIGSNDGRVKAIHRDQIVIEENYTDAYGGPKKRDVRMRLSTE
jgi:Tfp pilus assembly protein PilP